ncbi:hypothetical protein [Tepidimonas sp. HKU79]|uniref:hypothetical protein n=1 Tax=Tepidimonas sp. HKU79 TaxID=3414505 RepID=UPI003C7DA197
MDATTVTVLVGGWWLPGRHIAAGDTLTLDAATAEALARRGIVRLQAADVASNAGTEEASAPKAKRTRKETAQ